MELVEKNILPVESSLKEAIIGEEAPALCVDLQREGALGFLLSDFLLRPGGSQSRCLEDPRHDRWLSE